MDNIVTFDTVVDGIPISLYKDSGTNRMLENDPIEFLDETYYLLSDPAPDQGYYSAKALRIGDKIFNGEAGIHELRWKLLNPHEYGLSVNENTIIEGTKWGTLTVGQLMEKVENSPFFVDGVGNLVPIETNHIKDKTVSIRCVELNDTYYGDNGDEIHIYELSYPLVKDEDIKSYMDLPQFNVEFKGEIRKYVNSDEMHEIDICDWDHPFKVKENIGTIKVLNHKLKEQDKALVR